jgi:periplasmic protein TonB
MSQAAWNEPFLPWVESENDRRFKRILLASILIATILGVIVPYLPVPQPERKELKDVAPRLAKLILEKKKVVPPPPPKPKEEKKKETKKKQDQKKPKQKKTAKKEPPKPQSARKKAESAGLVALSDDLADLRESFDMSSLDNKPQQKTGKQATVSATTSAVLTAKATQGSGGINTGSLSRSTGGSELASRKTTAVKSSIGGTEKKAVRSSDGRSVVRSQDEIERVFQKNKGAIFSLYNRALRKDPTLQGKVVLELTIAPNGSVVQCRIVSSELNDPALERKLVSRVKLFKFKASNVSKVTITYPIDFLPS